MTQIIKPEFLYHGSPRGDIDEFIPRVSRGTGESYGPQVYASHDIATAIIFTATVKKTWSSGNSNNVSFVVIPLPREDFITHDAGGFLYTLKSDTFSSDSTRGLGEREWASSVPVKPVRVERIESSLGAMIRYGVQVYFVTDEQYKRIYASKRPDIDFLRKLTSENQLRGMNVRDL